MKRTVTADELMRAAEVWGIAETLAAAGEQCRLSVPVPQSMMDMHIDELTLSVRARNGLMRAGRDTVGKVVELIMSEKGIDSLRNVGRKTTVEIKAVRDREKQVLIGYFPPILHKKSRICVSIPEILLYCLNEKFLAQNCEAP